LLYSIFCEKMKNRVSKGGCIGAEDLCQLLTNILFIVLSIATVAVVGYILYRFHYYFLEGPYRVDLDEAKKTKYDIYLDVRMDWERSLIGKFPGSVNIPSYELEERLPQEIPDKKKKILVFCNSGHRAKMAVNKMRKMGYENAVYIAESHIALMN
jgi:phage shock protein E